jgi:ABC-type dipeptide/oligopeptide/nickel transport system permease subunit
MSRAGLPAGQLSAMQRFSKNRIAFASAIFILISIIVAILGYLVSPDSTPLANKQLLEISRQKPGFSIFVLKVTKNFEVEQRGFFGRMLFGQEDAFEEMPVDSISLDQNILIAYLHTNSPNPWPVELDLADVLFQVHPDSASRISSGILQYVNPDGIVQSIPLGDARSKLQKSHLIQRTYWLGTDRFGRDMLSQLLIGMRVSLSVGFMAVVISLLIGLILGTIAGYFGSWADHIIMWFINVIWALPSLLLVIAITFALGKGFWQVFLAIGLTMWVEVARVVRGQILSIREKEYIEAAKALGFGHIRTMFRHVLPNVISPVIVVSAANFATAILVEAGLSFLGIGVQAPMPSWGTMIRDHAGYIILDSAFLAFLPGFAIMLMVLAFMVVGNGLRDALDVRS